MTVHGDDFEVLGCLPDLRWLKHELQSNWELDDKGILGPPGFEGTVQSMVHLNRRITWDPDGILWEPDPRHAELVIAELGVGARVMTPLICERLE
eukprot:511442-Amphidinium_carterae.1